MNKLKNKATFIKDLINAFPELRDELLDEDYLGIITLQIACFKRFTQKAIDKNDLMVLKICYQFVNENIDQVEREIENALYVSYLGNLKFDKNEEAKNLLPERFKSAINDLNTYHNVAPKNDKLKDFLKNL